MTGNSQLLDKREIPETRAKKKEKTVSNLNMD
jgi:hypothetical protein